MKYLSILPDWRIVAYSVIAVLAFMLLAADCEDFGMFLFTKLLGLVLLYGCWADN